MTVSSASARVSSSWARATAASSASSAGISTSSKEAPRSSVCQRTATMRTRSTRPTKSASVPQGSCSTSGTAPSRLTIMSTVREKFAPMRSILLTKQMRGTPYLSAWRHTVSDCGSTPATESNTATAPSRTRSERSTSTVKSTWPGVSMMLISWSRHMHFVAAEVMVMPRSCSWAIQSIVAPPSCTSPIL